MRKKPGRSLSGEEARLWALAIQDAKPLGARPAWRDGMAAVSPPKRPPATPALQPPVCDGAPRPLGGLDAATERRLRRGALEPEAVLDLHGDSEAVAYPKLARFLEGAAERGKRCVLIVTGKGAGGAESASDGPRPRGRGVLRRALPLWLAAPPLDALVVGLREANSRHGGGGALYVILRKPKRPA